jgi:hypothetical protein
MSSIGGQLLLCIPYRSVRGAASWFPFAVRRTSAQATAPSAAQFKAANWRQKAVWAFPYYSAQGVATWQSWKKDPERKLTRRLYDLAHYAMVRVSVTETLFKAIDINASRIQIHHCAAEFPADAIALKLNTVLSAAPSHHRLRMILTGITVPFALVFLTALPGPMLSCIGQPIAPMRTTPLGKVRAISPNYWPMVIHQSHL